MCLFKLACKQKKDWFLLPWTWTLQLDSKDSTTFIEECPRCWCHGLTLEFELEIDNIEKQLTDPMELFYRLLVFIFESRFWSWSW